MTNKLPCENCQWNVKSRRLLFWKKILCDHPYPVLALEPLDYFWRKDADGTVVCTLFEDKAEYEKGNP